MFNELTARLRALPGIDGAAEAYIVPVSGSGWNNNIVLGGQARKENVNFNAVGPGYFRTMATPILAGRDFGDRDTPNSGKVAIVTEQFAKVFFDGASPVGRTFQVDEGQGVERPVYEIVGLVKDAKYTDLRQTPPRMVCFALLQGGGGPNALVLRTGGDPSALAAVLDRGAATGADPWVASGVQRSARIFARAGQSRADGPSAAV